MAVSKPIDVELSVEPAVISLLMIRNLAENLLICKTKTEVDQAAEAILETVRLGLAHCEKRIMNLLSEIKRGCPASMAPTSTKGASDAGR